MNTGVMSGIIIDYGKQTGIHRYDALRLLSENQKTNLRLGEQRETPTWTQEPVLQFVTNLTYISL